MAAKSELVTGHEQHEGLLVPTKKGEAGFPITEDSLREFLLSESVMKTDLSALVMILVGLEGCQKEDVVRHFLNKEVNPKGVEKKLEEVGERNTEGMSFYEFAVTGNSQKSGSYDWSFFTRSTGYLKCFISAFLRYQRAKMENCTVQTVQPLTGKKFFDEPILDEHFHIILEGLQSYFPQSQSKEESKLLEGLSAVNIWDIENSNKAVKLVLSMLAGKLNKSLVLLGHNLVEQVREPNDKKCLELLRFAHLAKDDDTDRHEASVGIGLVASSQNPTKKELEELTPLLKNLGMGNAKTVGVEGCVMEEPVIFDANNTGNIKQSIEQVARALFANTTSYPLSWFFLRSAFFKSGKLYVRKEELKEASSKLEITDESFDEFLGLFTATGSLIYNPQIPALKKYVVLNPADFCYRLNSLFKARFDGDLKTGVVPVSYLKRIFGSDADFFQEILASSKHAIKVNMKRIKYPYGSNRAPFPERSCFFIPIIREKVQEVKKHASSLYLQVKSTFLPNNVGQILVEQILRDASVSLVPTEYSDVVSFEYKAEDGQDFVDFSVILHADACEIRIEPSDGCRALLVRAVQSLLIDSCRFVRNSEKEMFVPFGTKVLGIGVMCTKQGGFHCFPCTEEPCQECAAAVEEWKPIYDKLVSDEISKNSIVTPEFLTKFAEQLYPKHISSVEDVQKLMKALGQPQESCTESTAAMLLSGALQTCAALKEKSSFALYAILNSVNPEYGNAFCTYLAAQV